MNTKLAHQFPYSELASEVMQRLVELGAPLLWTEAEGRLALAQRKLESFEQRYGVSLAHLRQTGLPEDASIEMHEDYVEWSGWQRTYEEASQIIASLRPLVERRLASSAAS
jgi:hypothetical protein